ncbi:hypothetical protein M3Y95_00435100 [Aphelenchoides besseyi]|nr:hypothetical protein M3Y95_00435100 [Aphelenchoides besseyi]
MFKCQFCLMISKFTLILLTSNQSMAIYTCRTQDLVYYSIEPCSNDVNFKNYLGIECPNGGALLGRRCQSAADCRYQAEAVGPAMGRCFEGRCCTAAYLTCTNHGQPLGLKCEWDSQCEQLNGVCSGGQCCTRPTDSLCPLGYLLSAFICQRNSQCEVDVNGLPTDGQCRQGRCCFKDRTKVVGCQQNEQSTGTSCLQNSDCSRGSLWAAASCRNGMCCEKRDLSIDLPPVRCDEGGVALAVQCTHDAQCWRVVNAPNQRAICQNGNCCVSTCANGGKPVGRACASNAQECAFTGTDGTIAIGRCEQGVCCSESEVGNQAG